MNRRGFLSLLAAAAPAALVVPTRTIFLPPRRYGWPHPRQAQSKLTSYDNYVVTYQHPPRSVSIEPLPFKEPSRQLFETLREIERMAYRDLPTNWTGLFGEAC